MRRLQRPQRSCETPTSGAREMVLGSYGKFRPLVQRSVVRWSFPLHRKNRPLAGGNIYAAVLLPHASQHFATCWEKSSRPGKSKLLGTSCRLSSRARKIVVGSRMSTGTTSPSGREWARGTVGRRRQSVCTVSVGLVWSAEH